MGIENAIKNTDDNKTRLLSFVEVVDMTSKLFANR
tara:strand:+ start:1499 stop:1603 length:105 start_codon:yes stop_codon:yes gene_type:complete